MVVETSNSLNNAEVSRWGNSCASMEVRMSSSSNEGQKGLNFSWSTSKVTELLSMVAENGCKNFNTFIISN